MGPGSNPQKSDLTNAYALGKFCAEQSLTVLTGGHNIGVMDEALKGAHENGGQTIGVLAFDNKDKASQYADHVIVTAMKSARNNINILTSDVVIACGLEAGTLSEVALALKAKKNVILLCNNDKAKDFLSDLQPENIIIAGDIEQAKSKILESLK